MKKQRILALTLAATTAISMFAGMSVSAATEGDNTGAGRDTTDGFHTYTFKDLSGEGSWTAGLIDNISFEAYDKVAYFEPTAIYLFDYKEGVTNAGKPDSDPSKVTFKALQEVVELAQYDLTNTDNVNAAITALTNYYGAPNAAQLETVDDSTMSDTRRAIVNAYAAQYKAAKDMTGNWTAFTESNPGDYLWEDLVYFGVNLMRNSFNTLTTGPYSVTGVKNSELAHMAAEGKRIMGELTVSITAAEKYEAKLEEVSALEADDYTATNFKIITRAIEDAEDLAAEEKYTDAIAKLNDALGTPTIAPTTEAKALETALKGLFTDKVIRDGIYNGTTDDKCAYLKADYDDVDAWREFAGYKTSTTDEEYVKGAYRAALEVYNKYRNPTTRKTLAKSTVAAAQEALDNAILALDPNFSTANWLTVKMEEALEKADKVVEDDYRTNTTAWKNFIKAKEALEKLLDNGAVKESAGETAINDLTTAQNNLKNVKKPVPSATASELTALKKEANTLLKKTDGKTLTQVEDLKKAAATTVKTGNTISEYEAAIDALKTAIANYNQLQGWYQENGVWYYGQGNGKATGWLHLGSDWYWLDQTTGAMAANTWKEINGAWYYFYGSGKMVAGKWHQVNGTWYSFTNSGAMRKGWFKSPDNDNWYYLNPSSGAMVANGWYKINGKDYYFYANGSMAANTTIGGYTVGADGAWVK